MKIQKMIPAGVALCATLLFGTSCSTNDNDEAQKEIPGVPVSERPDWDQTAVDYTRYDNEMPVVIGILPELAQYASEKDMMRAIIGGETRAWNSQPLEWETTDGIASRKFALNIAGNAGDGAITLEYYCDQLHRIYTVRNWRNYDASTSPTEKGQPYVPIFYSK
jgi:hypothetical protein